MIGCALLHYIQGEIWEAFPYSVNKFKSWNQPRHNDNVTFFTNIMVLTIIEVGEPLCCGLWRLTMMIQTLVMMNLMNKTMKKTQVTMEIGHSTQIKSQRGNYHSIDIGDN